MTDEQSTIHEFDRDVASVYGVVSALIYQHICWRSVNSPVRWVTFTLKELAAQYPYLTDDEVRNGLYRLVFPHGKHPALVMRKGKRGKSFLYCPVCQDPVVMKRSKFSVKLATQLGLVPALIHYNISYWIKRNWDEHAKERAAYYDPEKFDFNEDRLIAQAYRDTRDSAAHYCYIDEWVKDRPFISRPAAYRGFSCLLKANLLVRTYLRDRLPLWGFTGKEAKKHISKSLITKETRDSSLKSPHPVSNHHIQSQITTSSLISPQYCESTDSSSRRSRAFESSTCEAQVFRSAQMKQVKEGSDAFRPAGTASNRPSAKLALERKTRRELNRPNLPVYKAHGAPVKRAYNRKPVPQNEFDLNVMDDMTPEQRAAYVRQ